MFETYASENVWFVHDDSMADGLRTAEVVRRCKIDKNS